MRNCLLCIFLFFSVVTDSSAGPGDPTIRIFHAYTDQFLSAVPGNNVSSEITLQISQLNKALSDSGVRLNVVNAGIKKIANLPPESADFSFAFSAIRNNYPLQKARDNAEADVLMVLTHPGYTSVVKEVGPDFAEEAVAIVSYNNLPGYGYLHEFGHLLGARHQSSGGYYPIYNDPKGSGHGWYIRVKFWGAVKVTACFRTIMAYEPMEGLYGINCASNNNLQEMLFSNPEKCLDMTPFLTWEGSPIGCIPWGNSSNNNAAVMNSNREKVAGFRATKTARALTASFLTLIFTSIGIL